MTAVLDAPVVEETDVIDPDKLAHYFRKSEITESAVMGTPVTAVCGYVTVVKRTEDNLPVCKDCDFIFNYLMKD